MNISEMLAKNSALAVVNQKDSIISTMLAQISPEVVQVDGCVTMVNTEAIQQRGRFEVYPDKTEIFVWDGTPLLKFWPMEMEMDNGKITARQTYQVLSR